MPIICITSNGIKTTYYLDNKCMGLSLFTMRDIISHTFWQPYLATLFGNLISQLKLARERGCTA